MGNLNPDVRLRLLSGTYHMDYDGSVTLEHTCQLIGLDGQPLASGSSYGKRFAPNAWHTMTLPAMVNATHLEHHAHLELNSPTMEDTPLHLHPHGHPLVDVSRFPVTSPAPAPLSRDDQIKLRDAIIAAKTAELGVTIDPRTHPLTLTEEGG